MQDFRRLNRAIGLLLTAIRKTPLGDCRDWLCMALANLNRARRTQEGCFIRLAASCVRLALCFKEAQTCALV